MEQDRNFESTGKIDKNDDVDVGGEVHRWHSGHGSRSHHHKRRKKSMIKRFFAWTEKKSVRKGLLIMSFSILFFTIVSINVLYLIELNHGSQNSDSNGPQQGGFISSDWNQGTGTSISSSSGSIPSYWKNMISR
jgi:hypothetical protein